MEFEWDDKKAEINFNKHGVRFSEAVTVWFDDNALEISDPDHSDKEERWIRLGFSRAARLLTIVYVEKVEDERIRIISARKASRSEIAQYHAR